MTPELVCEQPGCPVAIDGRCFEGFADPAGCPHVHGLTANPANATEGSDVNQNHLEAADADFADPELDVDEDDAEAKEQGAGVEGARVEWIALGGDAALTLADADDVAQQAPCRVVLIAGEFDTGKTTLIVELYAQLLHGPFAGTEFGGSRTLRAFDRRHHPARADSGGTSPTTDRTAETDMRLLHLRLRRHDRVTSLLVSDVWGEFFENIVDGAAAAEQVPLAGRADLCILAVDGEQLAIPAERQVAATRARVLLGGLTEPGALRPTTPISIVATKADRLANPSARSWAEQRLQSLREFAESRGHPSVVQLVAARPPDGAPTQGLDALLDHILPPPQAPSPTTAESRPADRQFWNQPDAAR